MLKFSVAFATLMATLQPSFAGEADVLGVQVSKSGNGTYNFSVTVEHADAGWEHYADKWEVVTLDGKVLATRVLAHPHDNEQPFTRSKSGIEVPEGTTEVIIRAGDSKHGLGGKEMKVKLD
jgi:hypothetical protein